MSRKLLTLAAVSFTFGSSPSSQPVSAQECEYGKPIANLGFEYGWSARAMSMVPDSRGSTAAPATTGTFSFRDEPRVSAVERAGPADGKIQEGDRVARVNGLPSTSPEGTAALRGARIGHSVIITLRRADKLVPVTIVPMKSMCPTSRDYVPARVAQGAAASAQPVWEHNLSLDRVPLTSAVGATQSSNRAPANVASAASNPGWLGLAFDCTECGMRATSAGRQWVFSEPPRIYSVDTGSPAYKAGLRRGDVLLRVDGRDVLTSYAGTRLGQVRAGDALKLTYRRAGRTSETTLRVAQNPAAVQAVAEVRVAGELLKSTQELRATKQSAARMLASQLEQTHVTMQAQFAEMQRALVSAKASTDTRAAAAALVKMKAAHDATYRAQSQLLKQLVAAEQEGVRRLNVVERQIESAATRAQGVTGYTIAPDSAITFMRASTRDPGLRWSGVVGTANVEVRGPGSVSVQGDGEDLVIVTGDAVIRLTARKVRDR